MCYEDVICCIQGTLGDANLFQFDILVRQGLITICLHGRIHYFAPDSEYRAPIVIADRSTITFHL